MFGEATLLAARLAFSGLNSYAHKRFEKIIEHTIGVPVIAGSETAPEAPADTFENALPPHILPPLLRTVETITVAFNGQTPSIRTLDNHINTIANRPDLALHSVASLQKLTHQIALELGFAHVKRVANFFDIRHRVFKMRNKTCLEVIRV